MSDAIIDTVAAFLQRHEPFNFLSEADLRETCRLVKVKFYEEGAMIFEEGKAAGDIFFVVYKGAISLSKQLDGEEVLLDVCGEGDVFGFRALLVSGNYAATAKAREESLLYHLPAKQGLALLEKYPRFASFFAESFAAQLPGRAQRFDDALQSSHQKATLGHMPSHEHDFKTVPPTRKVITASAGISLQEAAALMTDKNIGSLIIVDEKQHPRGIITDSDFRRKVVSVNLDVQQVKVESAMSTPVVTIRDGLTVSELILIMVRHRIRHFCLTEDGTPNSRITGIISERDIVSAQGSNPAALIREMSEADNRERLKFLRDQAENLLKDYLRQGIATHFITAIMTDINDTLVRKLVALALNGMNWDGWEIPNTPFCWLSLGSEGRKEQLLRTDQDNALIYLDAKGSKAEKNKKFFLELGGRVVELLAYTGFEKCPGEVMASNPKWCLPLSGWKAVFDQWVHQPDPQSLMHSHIFFDFRPVAGDFSLADALRGYVQNLVGKQDTFKSSLAYNALLNPPPLSFFRNFVVEKKGGFSDQFDIKARALSPLSDAARVLAWELLPDGYHSTEERYNLLAEKLPASAALLQEAAMAYGVLLKMRAESGLAAGHSGRYVHIHGLNKLQQRMLRNVFDTISQVQRLLRVRYRTDFLA